MSTATRTEVERLLERLPRLPHGERVAPAEEAARAADGLGDPDLRFDSRLTLLQAYHYSGERHRMLAPFAHLLTEYDAAPTWMDRWRRLNVLWHYKWMVTALVDLPQVPHAQLQGALDGMRERYLRADQGPAPVLGCAYVLAAHVHGAEAAQREYEAWVHAPRTRLSDCEGCEPSTRIRHLAQLGRHEEAVVELDALLASGTGCIEQPQGAVAAALASLVEVGAGARAADLHLRTVRTTRRNRDETDNLTRHLLVLARTGNLTRGLDLLADQLHVLDRPTTPGTGMRFAAAGARLLAALVDDGRGEAPVRRRDGASSTVADLLPRLRAHALDLAARFDERNGTTAVGDRVRGTVGAPALDGLVFGAASRGADPVEEDGIDLDVRTDPEHPGLRDLDDLDRLSLAELQDLCELARRFAHEATWNRLADHWEGRREAALARAQEDPATRRDVAELEYFGTWRSRTPRPEQAASAARLFRLVGDEAEAVLVETLVHVRAGEQVDWATAVDAVDRTGTALQRARVRCRPGPDDDPADVARWRQEGLALLEGGDPRSPQVRETRAHLLVPVHDGTVDPAHEDGLRAALAQLGPGEHADLGVRTRVALASLRWAADDAAQARRLADEAVAHARAAGAPDLLLRAVAARARFAAEPEEGERLLGAVVAQFEARGDDVAAAELRCVLAERLAGRGRVVEAADLVETALAALPSGEPSPDAQVRRHEAVERLRLLDLGSRLSQELGEHDRAVALARAAVGHVGAGELGAEAAGRAHVRLAELLTGSDPVEATSAYARALEAAVASRTTDLELVVRRERVWARLAADGCDAALTDLDDALAANARAEQEALVDREARERTRGWAFAWEPLALASLRARVLARSEREADALAALHGVPEQMLALDQEPSALETEVLRARLLLATGREADGLGDLERVAARARVLGHRELVRHAAATGTRWLDEAGRSEDAQAFWDRWGEPDED